jgi:hypothetical protein
LEKKPKIKKKLKNKKKKTVISFQNSQAHELMEACAYAQYFLSFYKKIACPIGLVPHELKLTTRASTT